MATVIVGQLAVAHLANNLGFLSRVGVDARVPRVESGFGRGGICNPQILVGLPQPCARNLGRVRSELLPRLA